MNGRRLMRPAGHVVWTCLFSFIAVLALAPAPSAEAGTIRIGIAKEDQSTGVTAVTAGNAERTALISTLQAMGSHVEIVEVRADQPADFVGLDLFIGRHNGKRTTLHQAIDLGVNYLLLGVQTVDPSYPWSNATVQHLQADLATVIINLGDGFASHPLTQGLNASFEAQGLLSYSPSTSLSITGSTFGDATVHGNGRYRYRINTTGTVELIWRDMPNVLASHETADGQRSAFIGFNTYGSHATGDAAQVLRNAINWLAPTPVAAVVPAPGAAVGGLVLSLLMALARRR